jgi:hypothetical protein
MLLWILPNETQRIWKSPDHSLHYSWQNQPGVKFSLRSLYFKGSFLLLLFLLPSWETPGPRFPVRPSIVHLPDMQCLVLHCCRNLKLRYRTLRQFTRRQHFIVPAQTQQTRVQGLSSENKEVSPYILLQVGYRSKKQSSTHIWLHVTLLGILFPQCYVTSFMFQFFKFYFSALPFLLPASLSEHSCLFLFWFSSLLQHQGPGSP